MIKAVFERREEERVITLTVYGHACYAEIGTDIVCASASILTYTIAEIVQGMYEKGNLEEYPIIRLNGGDALIECKCKDYLTF